jgi:hypothetical protein
MEVQDLVTRAGDKLHALKEFALSQSTSKLLFVGGAIALFSYAAYSFLTNGEDVSEGSGTGKTDQKENQTKAATTQKKKKPNVERKIFTEEEIDSDEVSTSNPHERRSVASTAGRKKKSLARKLESVNESGELRLSSLQQSTAQATEEADDLYFALLGKLNS